MSGLDLRPLSTGEILDRTFTLYRRHFLLFVGLAAIPEVPALGINLSTNLLNGSAMLSTVGTLVGFLASLLAYVFSQGGAIVAVSKLYLGHSTTIAASLRETLGRVGGLIGVLILNGLAIGVGFLLLVIPGIILMCRLLVCVPVALIEGHNPSDSLSRSFELTRNYAGRAFLILLLYFVLAIGAGTLVDLPVVVPILTQGPAALPSQPALALVQVLSFLVNAVLTPVLLIATSVFYYDLRVRKEAFDLQVMMGRETVAGPNPSAPPSLL